MTKRDDTMIADKREGILEACIKALRNNGKIRDRVAAIVRTLAPRGISAEEILEGIIDVDDLSRCGLGDERRLIPIHDAKKRKDWLERVVHHEYVALMGSVGAP